jgi:hypothetical protein
MEVSMERDKDRFGYFLESLYRIELMPTKGNEDLIMGELLNLDMFVKGLRPTDGLTADERYSMQTLIHCVRKRKEKEGFK